jgi:hypothetical protein
MDLPSATDKSIPMKMHKHLLFICFFAEFANCSHDQEMNSTGGSSKSISQATAADEGKPATKT